jgi:hypothetical protein
VFLSLFLGAGLLSVGESSYWVVSAQWLIYLYDSGLFGAEKEMVQLVDATGLNIVMVIAL